MNNFKDRTSWTPEQTRSEFRQNNFPGVSTGDIAMGHVQASVAILPSSVAGDFAEFCKMNWAPCPLLYQAKAGEVSAPPLAADSDIRTDLSMYSIMENGRYSKVAPDVLDTPFNDLVSFYIGCSYSFEHALSISGLPLRHIDSGCNVPGYITDIPCHSAGPFAANLVVSMRPFPRRLVQKAVEATADLHLIHGAPIHIGDPGWIGIKDFALPDFDDAPVNEDGDVCLFWACGTSAALALRDASLPFAIGLGPETNQCVFVTDHKVDDFFKLHPPKHASLKPRVLFISEEPAFGSLLSDKALEQIYELEKSTLPDSSNVGPETSNSLAEAAMTLNHASSIAVVALDERISSNNLNVLPIIKASMATGEKKIVLLVPEGKGAAWEEIINRFIDQGILRDTVRIVQLETKKCNPGNDDMQVFQSIAKTLPSLDEFQADGVFTHKFTAVVGPRKKGTYWVACAAEMMAENSFTASRIPSTWIGNLIARAIFIVNNCPIHSRYKRRGLGIHTVLDLEDYIITPDQVEMNKITSTETSNVLEKEH